MTAEADFRAAYESALRAFFDDPDEAGLGVAYELGRDAVGAELGVLDIATNHNQIVHEILRDHADREAVAFAVAAGDFFLESLSAFEMVQRGFRETHELALAEQRQAAILRRLSGFLADAALALEGPNALAEVLQLVAEQTRELVGAGWCLATLALGEGSEPLAALAADASQVETVDPSSLHKVAPAPPEHPIRTGSEELADDPAWIAVARLLGLDRPLDGRLAVPLVSLDGRELGSLQLFDKSSGFTDVDEATVVHLAEMAAAAVERLQLYSR